MPIQPRRPVTFFAVLTSFLSLVLLASPIRALAHDAVAAEAQCETGLVNPLLFQAEKDGKVTYILGTMHIGVSLESLPAQVKHLISQSDVLVTEILMPTSALGKLWMALRAIPAMYRLSGPKLSESLSPEALAKLKEKFKSKGLAESMIDTLSPMGAFMMLAVDASKMKDGSLDAEIGAYAQSCGLKHIALESAGFQIKALKSVCDIQSFEAQLLSPDDESFKVEDAFRSGDLEAFNSKSAQLMAESPRFNQVMLIGRNQSWIPQIEKFHGSSQKYFLAFGALHLAGDDGVLKLLERAGFTVSRVNFP